MCLLIELFSQVSDVAHGPLVIFLQKDVKDQLRQGLAGLPRPKNDYEIVVEDLGEDMEETNEGVEFVADQADVDEQSEAEYLAKRTS